MRVIAGRAKGHQLKGPPDAATRPTSDKVRGAIFAMLESLLSASRAFGEDSDEVGVWEDLRVLDLYAGTGALGIEALSRGARSADFVETSTAACKVIKENLSRTKLAPFGRVHCASARRFLHQIAATESQAERGYELVLMDPPYAEAALEDVLTELASAGALEEGGWLVVEHSARRPMPDEVASLRRARARRHGDTNISIYTRPRPT